MNVHKKKLYRSTENKVIFGVMGGLGEYFDIDPVLFRVSYVAFCAITAFVPGVFAYIFMAIVMPKRGEVVHEASTSTSTPS